MSYENQQSPDAGLFARLIASSLDVALLFVIERLITVGLLEPKIDTSVGIWLTKYYYGYFEGAELDRAVMITEVFNYAWPALVFSILCGTYFSLFEASRYQGTFGKIIVGLKVVSPKGGRVSFYRAFTRNLFKLASIAPIGIGLLLVLFTDRRQGLHDLIAKTYVIQRADYSLLRALLAIPFIGIVLFGGYLSLGMDFEALLENFSLKLDREREVQRFSSDFAVVQDSAHDVKNTLFGSFGGRSFAPKEVSYRAGVLKFADRQDPNNPRVIEIFLTAKPKSLSGKRFSGSGSSGQFSVTTIDKPPGVRTAIRKALPSSSFTLNLMFGTYKNGSLPGGVELKINDRHGGNLRGSFSVPVMRGK